MLLDSPIIVQRYKDIAGRYVLEKYSWDRVVDQMLRIYEGDIVEYKDVVRDYDEKMSKREKK